MLYSSYRQLLTFREGRMLWKETLLMLFNDKGQTGSRYNEVRFQETAIGEMGELLPVELIEACDLENARSVLEIGCGAGEWLRSVARDYPRLQCIGIDQD